MDSFQRRLRSARSNSSARMSSEHNYENRATAYVSNFQSTINLEEDSEDEEWVKLQRQKGAKQSRTRTASMFQSQYEKSLRHASEGGFSMEEEKKGPANEEQKEDSDELDSDDEFFVAPPEIGDQFMACKPWLGAIKEPTEVPIINPSPPQDTYEIDFVHGYKSDLTRQNLYYNNN